MKPIDILGILISVLNASTDAVINHRPHSVIKSRFTFFPENRV